jgi:hypothetical protein
MGRNESNVHLLFWELRSHFSIDAHLEIALDKSLWNNKD